MSKVRDANKVRVIFYPMAGSVNEQFSNLLKTIEWIQTNKPTPHEVYEWLRLNFNLKHYFAVNVYTVLFVSSGLVTVHDDGVCHLTTDGQSVLATASPAVLLEVFEKTFAGVAVFLEVLRAILLQFLRLPSNAFCGKDIGNLSTEAHDGNPRPSTLLRLFVAL